MSTTSTIPILNCFATENDGRIDRDSARLLESKATPSITSTFWSERSPLLVVHDKAALEVCVKPR